MSGNEHPYPAGTRVYHAGQQWHRAHMDGTAHVVDSKGPYSDGSYEYDVLAGEDFSRQTGPDNPETRRTWWSSMVTAKVAPTER